MRLLKITGLIASMMLIALIQTNLCNAQGQVDAIQVNEDRVNDAMVDQNMVVYTQKALTTPLYDDKLSLDGSKTSDKAGFKNLEVYLLYGTTETDKKEYVTLNDALKQGLVKVHETGTVNQLQISNYSNKYIYINSGDIVKGGKQDRTIKYDIVVGPNMTNVDLASFCVEHGRWSQRNGDAVNDFGSSEKSLSSSDLKVAARHNSNQSEVWQEVKEYQVTTNDHLNSTKKAEVGVQTVPTVNVDVTANVSSTSLELTLENKDLIKANDEYKTSIIGQLTNKQDAIGMVYFINGKLYSIDVYNNHRLFADLFDKLLDAAISEAISVGSQPGDSLKTGDINTVNTLLKADAKVYLEEPVNTLTQAKTSENNVNKDMIIFSTIDLEEKTWIHRNWIIK